MRRRNSISYTNKKRKTNIFSRNRETNKYNEKINKNRFLNNLEKKLKNDNDFIKKLNNTFKNYELNIKRRDTKIATNLYNISVNRFINMKNKLKKSERLLREYDNQYGLNFQRNIRKINTNKTDKILLSKTQKKDEDYKDNNSSIFSEANINHNDEYCLSKNSRQNSKKDINNGKFKRHYSVYYNENNYAKKFRKIIINEKKIREKMRRIEQLTSLLNDLDVIEKKEAIDNNKCFKVEKTSVKYLPFYRKKINGENRVKSALYRFKLNKNKIKLLSEEKSIYNKKNISFSPKKKESSIKNLKKNFRSQFNMNTLSDFNSDNLSNISNIQKNMKRSKYSYSSSSFLNFNSNHNKKKAFLLNLSPKENKNMNFSIQRKREIRPIMNRTIDEGKKINEIIKKNYSLHKEPKIIKKRFIDILKEEKKDFSKLRDNLKLKDSNGINGSINEIQIMENNIKKMEKYITKKGIKIVRAVARGMIKQDLLLHKRLIYNVGFENRVNRQKYLDLFNSLKNPNIKKKDIENNLNFLIN